MPTKAERRSAAEVTVEGAHQKQKGLTAEKEQEVADLQAQNLKLRGDYQMHVP